MWAKSASPRNNNYTIYVTLDITVISLSVVVIGWSVSDSLGSASVGGQWRALPQQLPTASHTDLQPEAIPLQTSKDRTSTHIIWRCKGGMAASNCPARGGDPGSFNLIILSAN